MTAMMISTAHIPLCLRRRGARCRDSTLPGVIALALTAPLAYEANPGIVQGVAPQRHDGGARARRRAQRARPAAEERQARVPARADRPAAARHHGDASRRWPASACSRSHDGRPRLRPAGGGREGRAAAHDQRAGAGARSRPCPRARASSSAAWVRDLGNGSTAAYNAGARYPAASTIKLAILLGVLARDDADPLRSSSWPLERALVLSSSNSAANALIPRAGGAGGRRRASRARSARPRRSPAAATCSRPASAPIRAAAPSQRRPLPPSTVVDQPAFPCCKYTTAHDLGTLLVSLTLAASRSRPGAAARDHGARGARRAVAADPRELSRASCARPWRSRSATRPAGCPTSSTTPRSSSRPAARSSRCS